MRYRLALVLALVLISPAAGEADEAPSPPTPEAIDLAIERGVGWLLQERRPQGTWATGSRSVGHTALALFTLQHAGVDAREEAAVARSLAWLDRNGPGRKGKVEVDAPTYDVALILLLLRDRGRPEDRERIQTLVRTLEATQAENGQWSYEGAPAGARPQAGDNSNTQFAVLALGAAVGENVPVAEPTLRRALAWWTISPQADGGFGYASGGSRASVSTGSMTAAGIASVAILRAALGGRAPALAARVGEAAVGRLADGFEVDRNFGPPQGAVRQRQRNAGRGWNHYFLWSVERAMVLAGRERLGDHDWYADGARHLLATQKKDGSWRGEHPLYATCFALLFLTRAADPPRAFTPRPSATGPVTPGDAPAAVAGVQDEAPVEGEVEDWLREDLEPGVLHRRCLARGPTCLLPLVRGLAARQPAIRQRANETLRLLLGDERVGRADRHPLARGRLELWVRKNARFLERREQRFEEV